MLKTKAMTSAMWTSLVLTAALASPAFTQNVLHTVYGDALSDHLGSSVSGAGDVNNDGYDDFIAGAPMNDVNGTRAGMIRVYSGQDGADLYTRYGDAAHAKLGTSVGGTGDVDNDGHADFIAGAPYSNVGGTGSGMIRVYSGKTGALLYSKDGDAPWDYLGTSVSGAGDVDNDGYDDFIVGAPGNDTNGTDSGMIRVYSGQSGAILYSRYGVAEFDRLGSEVSGAGDVNNDGHADFIAGAIYHDTNGAESGLIRVYSGQTGAVLYDRTGDAPGDYMGSGVGGAGDVNNDGYDDFIAGASHESTNGLFSGMIRVYSGQTGAVLYERHGAAGDLLGGSVSGAGDMNNDGYDDFIAGAMGNENAGLWSGMIRVYSGQTGAVLFTRYGGSPFDALGNDVNAAGDVNADGIPDIIAGSFSSSTNGYLAGMATVFTGPCALIESYGAGCLGAGDTHIPELLIETDCWGTGGTIQFKIQNAWGGGHAFLLAGTQRASIPWIDDCNFLVAAPRAVIYLGTLDNAGPPPNGNGSMDLPVAITSPMAPGSLTLQVGIVQPTSDAYTNLTNGLEIRVP